MVPCKGCAFREVGCHSRCDAYLLYKKELEQIHAEQESMKVLKAYIADVCKRQHKSYERRLYG